MDKEKVYNEAVGGDEGFAAGDGYPSCDGEPCANVTDESSADADTMAGDRNTPKAASEELPSRDWEAEIAEWQDKYLRLQAEFDNFRKRTLREKMELVQSGSAECVKNFLPLMDDLQRALEAIEKSNDLEALREGVKLIAQKFRNAQETECEGDRGARTGVGYRSPRGGCPFRCREGEEGQDRRCGTARLQDGRQGVAFCESGRRRVTGVFV